MRTRTKILIAMTIAKIIMGTMYITGAYSAERVEEYDLYVYTRDKPNDEIFIGRHLDLSSCLSQLALAQTNVDALIMLKFLGEAYKGECRSLDTGIIKTLSMDISKKVSYPIFEGCAWPQSPPCEW